MRDSTEAIRLEPELATAYLLRGMTYGKQKLTEQALVDLSHAIALDPTLVMAYFNRAVGRGIKGDLHGAIADYSAAIKLKPDFLPGYLNRGKCYRALHDGVNAEQDKEMFDRLRSGKKPEELEKEAEAAELQTVALAEKQ